MLLPTNRSMSGWRNGGRLAVVPLQQMSLRGNVGIFLSIPSCLFFISMIFSPSEKRRFASATKNIERTCRASSDTCDQSFRPFVPMKNSASISRCRSIPTPACRSLAGTRAICTCCARNISRSRSGSGKMTRTTPPTNGPEIKYMPSKTRCSAWLRGRRHCPISSLSHACAGALKR